MIWQRPVSSSTMVILHGRGFAAYGTGQLACHTTDPVGMLRTLWKSMKPKGMLIVDCQGISLQEEEEGGEEEAGVQGAPDQAGSAEQRAGQEYADQPLVLVPRRTYARANGAPTPPLRPLPTFRAPTVSSLARALNSP